MPAVRILLSTLHPSSHCPPACSDTCLHPDISQILPCNDLAAQNIDVWPYKCVPHILDIRSCQGCHSPLLTMSSFRRSRSCAVFGSLLGDMAGGAACSSVCNGGPAKHASIVTVQSSACLRTLQPIYMCIKKITSVQAESDAGLSPSRGRHAGANAACICQDKLYLQRHISTCLLFEANVS